MLVVFPDGKSSTLQGGQIQELQPDRIRVLATLATAGQWSFTVVSPDGLRSDAYSLIVGENFDGPRLISASPPSVFVNPKDQELVFVGSGFTDSLSVEVSLPDGGHATLSAPGQILMLDSASFRALVLFGRAGGYGFTALRSDGRQSNTLTVQADPASTLKITGVSPQPVPVSSTDSKLTIQGVGFREGLTVDVAFPIGGGTTLSGQQITRVSSGEIDVLFAPRVAGAYVLQANNPDGTESNSFTIQVVSSVSRPVITSTSPSRVFASRSDQQLTVYGNDFREGLTVKVNFPNGGNSTLSGDQVRGVTPSSFVLLATFAEPGTYSLQATNADGNASPPYEIKVETGALAPDVTGIAPSVVFAGSSDQRLTVFGRDFRPGLNVSLAFPNGDSRTLSGSQIQNVTNASFELVVTFGATGTYGLTVNNPDGGRSSSFPLEVLAPATLPTVSAINPSSPTATASDQNVVVAGSSFQSGLTVDVYYNGTWISTLSGSQIQGVTANSFTMVVNFNRNAGSYGIEVINPGNKRSSPFVFTVRTQQSAPSVSGISPPSPAATAGNQNVSVSGSNFQSGLTVTVGFPSGGSSTLSGSQIQGVSANSFTMVINFNNNPGTYTIRVNNPDGAQSNVYSFSVGAGVSTPQISGVQSGLQATAGNQNVSVSGSQFQSGLTVTVGFPSGGNSTLSGSQIQGVSANSFTMVINFNNNPGTYTIRVNNPDGGQSNVYSFSVAAGVSTPQISGVQSGLEATAGNQNVSVSGSQFQSGLTVTVGFPSGGSSTLSGSQIQGVSANSFTMVINFNNNPGTYTIRVNNPDGGQSNVYSFSVAAGVSTPQISGVQSGLQATAGNQNVSVSGSQFQSGLTVTVGFPSGGSSTLSGSQIQGVSANSFTMVINFNNNPGTYTIRVNNPDGGQSNVYSFSVAAGVSTPQISGVQSGLRATAGNQNVSVSGSQFQSGLTVTVGFPSGGSTTLSGSQIQGVSANSFTMVINFNNNPGTYTIRVNNPDGGQSNVYSFSVAAGVSTPQISGVQSGLQATAGNQNVSVSGSQFQSGLTVTVGFPSGGSSTLSGSQIQGVSANSFTMVINFNNNPGTYTARVNNPDGGQSNVYSFSVAAGVSTPSISGVQSGLRATAGNQNVSVSGSQFQSGLTVTVGFPSGGSSTLSGSQIQGVSANSFTMVINFNNNPGTYTIRVNNPDGGQSNVYSFSVAAGVSTPQISGVQSGLQATAGNQNVSVSGSQFQSGLTVTVGFPSGGSSTLSGSQIQGVSANSFTMVINFNNNPGTYTIRVNNPDGGQSNVYSFSVAAGVSTPSISGVQSGLRATAGNQNVSVSGSQFQSGLTVTVGFPSGGSSTLSGSQIQGVSANSFTMVINFNNNPGTYTIRVNNPDGGQSNVYSFSVAAGVSTPQISGVQSGLQATAGNQNVSVSGSQFQSGLTVTVGFPSGGSSTLSGSQIQGVSANSFTMVINFNNNPGTYTIRVNNPDGGQSNVYSFSVAAGVSTPSISGVQSGLRATAGNQNVSVSGSQFQSGLTVTVGFPSGGSTTLSGSQIQGVSANSFTMVINFNNNPGTYTIRVNNPDGGQSNVYSFSVAAGVSTPQISGVQSGLQATAGNQNVSVSGSQFQSGLTVTVGFPSGGSSTLSGSQIQGVSANSFTMVINFNNNPGTYTARVNNPDGGQSNVYSFSVAAGVSTPQISGVQSGLQATAGNQNVSVSGSQFQSGLTVTVGFPSGGSSTLSGSQIQGVSANSFTMVINFNNNPGTYTARVNNPDGGQSNVYSFSVAAGVSTPSISGVQSGLQATAGNQNVSVSGSQFQSGLTVTVGFPSGGSTTLSGSQIQGVSANSFTMVINFNNNPGTYTARVNNPDGGQSNVYSFSVAAGVSTPSISGVQSGLRATAGNQNVSVSGSQFQSGLTVTVGFPSGGSTTLSGSQIQGVSANSFTMVINFNNNPGTYTARVNNPDGGQSNVYSFSVAAGVSTPSISGVQSGLRATAGNQNVSVSGSQFQSGLTVTVGFPSGGSTTLSGSQIQGVSANSFTMVINFNNNPGTYTARVNNPDGGQSNVYSFSVAAGVSTPSISGVQSGLQATAGNQNVSVSGSQFQSGLTVTVGFPSGGSTTLSGSQIQGVSANSFTMVINFNNNPGTYTARVNNPDGGQSNVYSFSVAAATPQITSISPSTPSRAAGNQNVWVYGSGFQSGLTVTVFFPSGGSGTLSGTQIQNVSAGSFMMVINFNNNPGSYSIRANNPSGPASNNFSFNVN